MPVRSIAVMVALVALVLFASCGGQRSARVGDGSAVVAAPIAVLPSVRAPLTVGTSGDGEWTDSRAQPPQAAPPTLAVLPASAVDPADPDGSSPYAREIAVCRGFLAWAERYHAADASGRKALSAEGIALAGRRRAALVTLVRADPQRALALKLPLRERALMPPAIATQLERRLAGDGRFTALARLPSADAVTADDQRAVVPVVIVGDESFERSTYGRRATLLRGTVPVHGIILDGVAAIHEDAVRPLEAGEVMDPHATPANPDLGCPVSGEVGEVVADLAGRPLYLCSSGHIRLLNDRFAASEAAESSKAMIAQSSWTEGAKTVLYIRARFTDQSDSALPTAGTCENTVNGMSAFLNQNSYGRLSSFTATVPPIVVLAGSAGSYGTDDRRVRTDALAAARAAGFEPNNFDFDVVRYSGGPGSFAGQGYVGARGVWMKSDSVGVATHEFGHNLGLWHANFWVTSTGSPIGPGTVSEYGNNFDTMGAANAGANHFNAGSKQVLGWLPYANVHITVGNGTFRVFPQDHATLLPTTQKQALRVTKDANRHYVVEFRQRFTSSLWQMNGVTVKWNGPSNGDGQDLLLDSTPGSPDGKNDAAVVIGQTFSDRTAGIHITPIALGGTSPPSIDVVVNQGPFPGNRNPSVASSGPSTAAIGTAISLSATASDPDGDALAYSWDFGDRTVSTTNSATVSKQWSSAGGYVVRCTVSDRKGGVASDSMLVTVGSPTVFTITGRVSDGAGGVQGVRIHNGQSGGAYRGTVTDSDGTYILGNLASGPVTVSAISALHTLTTSFTNPVSVGPDASGKDFAATRLDEISITASDASAAETGGDTATFRISRTTAGAAAITVNLALSGSAVRPGAAGTDYALTGGSITLAGANATVTIPAGQASVNVVLTATSDALTEGAETATLTLSENSAYAVLAPTAATATIAGTPGPANDDFAGRITLSGPSVTTTGTNRFATREVGEPAHHGAGGTASVWWTWTAPASGLCTIDLSGSAFDTVLAVYTGTTVGGLTTIASDDDSGTNPDSKLSFAASIGTVYQIAVDGFDVATSQGAIALALSQVGPPVATIVATDATATEAGTSTATFTVTLSRPAPSAVAIAYSVTGSAAPSDHQPLTSPLVIAAGASSGTITLTPIDDSSVEGSETVVITLTAGSGYALGSPVAATATITDNDAPIATLVATTAAASETGPTAGLFTVTLSSATTSAITVGLTLGGTATAGDYQAVSAVIPIAAGASSGTLAITPIDDAASEGAETVVATLTPGAGYTPGAPASATVTITDNDAPPSGGNGGTTTGSGGGGGGGGCGLGSTVALLGLALAAMLLRPLRSR